MLPDGFRWTARYQYAPPETAVELRATMVACLDQRLDGAWVAHLDVHGAARRSRACTSLESGRAGIEAWIQRHEARLRAEVEAIPWPRHCGAG